MATDQINRAIKPKRIVVKRNGPYVVEGGVPLVRKTQVVSEYGEPLTWRKEGTLPTSEGEDYLCRCGQSSKFPFCDSTHRAAGFDGTESADSSASEGCALRISGGAGIIVRKDPSLCMDSGYCGLRDASLEQLVAATHDTQVRSLVIAMVERCPSGSLTYRIDEAEPDIEPDLPCQIAVTTEITPDGPIAGPLWVTGGIPIERSDGQPFAARNRVTLCNCGRSRCKPLCDGTHRALAQRQARRHGAA